jgi:uncharacterized protein (DUF1778 family)
VSNTEDEGAIICEEDNIYYLDAEQWEKFNAILNRPPRVLHRLRDLFEKGSIFEDEV